MSAEADSSANSFRTAYSSAFNDYLVDRSESSLQVAYDLGREAVTRELGVLELAVAHHEAFMAALDRVRTVPQAQEVARAGGDFFLESLVSFEMIHRGSDEARQALRLERRQTRLSRQLSSFFADASLAGNASDSLQEILQLVSERARELVDAECCVTSMTLSGRPRLTGVSAHSETDERRTKLLRWLDHAAIYPLVRSSGGSLRMTGEQLARLPVFQIVGNSPPREWLAASLNTLDGSELGTIQVFDKRRGRFTREDEAALVHLAQVASAAIERTTLYEDTN